MTPSEAAAAARVVPRHRGTSRAPFTREQSLRVLLPLVALLATALRLAEVLNDDGLVDISGGQHYDEGVYFSAAGLLADGAHPYRDFTFLHPPGVLVLLAPFAALGRAVGYPEAYHLAQLVGACVAGLVTYMAGSLARAWRGTTAGLAAALLYATFPVGVRDDARLLLEPFVCFLTVVAAWLLLKAPHRIPAPARPWLAGAAVGLAAGTKLYAGVFLIACLVALPLHGSLRRRLALVGGSAVAFLAVLAPFAASAGLARVVEQIVLVQMQRPLSSDPAAGTADRTARLAHMLGHGPIGAAHTASALAVAAFVLLLVTSVVAVFRGGPAGRLWGVSAMLWFTVLLVSPSYYDQYPLVLAPATTILAGAAVAVVLTAVQARAGRTVAIGAAAALRTVAIGAAAALLVAFPLLSGVRNANQIFDIGGSITPDGRAATDSGGCVVAYPPALALALDRLPARQGSAPILADPFGDLLASARTDPTAQGNTLEDALIADRGQVRLRAALAACDTAVIAGPVDEISAWSTTTLQEFLRTHHLAVPPGEPGGPEVWVRR